MRDLLIISCSPCAKEDTQLFPALKKLGFTDYHFFENNRRGLPDCYNEVLDKWAGTDKIVILIHADVTIADIFLREKINEAIQIFNIVGLVGSSKFDINLPTPHYQWTVWPRECLSGAVEQVLANGEKIWFSLGPTPRRCVALDGLFLALDMLTIGKVRFDRRFAFHLYDLDLCMTANLANLALGTTNVYVRHASLGNFKTEAYKRAMQEFRDKWRPILGTKTKP